MSSENKKRQTILVVDDELAFQQTLQEILSDEGFEVDAAGNGQAALDYLRASDAPDLIVLDLMMPIMNGWQFIQQKMKDPKLAEIPVIVLTAGRTAGKFEKSEKIFGFLSKPFKLNQFLRLVHDALHFGRSKLLRAAS